MCAAAAIGSGVSVSPSALNPHHRGRPTNWLRAISTGPVFGTLRWGTHQRKGSDQARCGRCAGLGGMRSMPRPADGVRKAADAG